MAKGGGFGVEGGAEVGDEVELEFEVEVGEGFCCAILNKRAKQEKKKQKFRGRIWCESTKPKKPKTQSRGNVKCKKPKMQKT